MKDKSINIDNLRFCSLKQFAEYFNHYRREFQSGFFKIKKVKYDEKTDDLVMDLIVIEENLAECQKLPEYRKVIDIDKFVMDLKEEYKNAKN